MEFRSVSITSDLGALSKSMCCMVVRKVADFDEEN